MDEKTNKIAPRIKKRSHIDWIDRLDIYEKRENRWSRAQAKIEKLYR